MKGFSDEPNGDILTDKAWFVGNGVFEDCWFLMEIDGNEAVFTLEKACTFVRKYMRDNVDVVLQRALTTSIFFSEPDEESFPLFLVGDKD